MKLRTSHIIKFRVPFVGRFRSHGNLKTKRYQKELKKDREKKRIKYWKKKNEKSKV